MAAELKRRRATTTKRGGREEEGYAVACIRSAADEGRRWKGSISLSASLPWLDWIIIELGSLHMTLIR
jgi:hypothetical protein